MNRNEGTIAGCVVAAGISAMVLQLLTIREFLSQFQGNEFIIALVLFNWLVISGFGVLLSRCLQGRPDWVTVAGLGRLAFLLSILPTLQILGIRWLRDVVFIPGSGAGFYPILAYTGLFMLPCTLLLGFLLPYSLMVLKIRHPNFPGTRIYILDNIGNIAGGSLFAFLLVHFASPLQAVLLANLPLLAAALGLSATRHRVPALLSGSLVLAVLLAGVFLESGSLIPAHGRLVHYRETRYGRIAVHQHQNQFTLYANGMPFLSTDTAAAAEESIHLALAQVETVRHILLIGTRGNMLAEVGKHMPVSVDYVELDPEITRAGFDFGFIQKTRNLRVIHADARVFLKTSGRQYHAIIVNLPEPETFQLNRFFTDRFFRLAKQHLTADGILSFTMQGGENYLAEPQRRKLSSVYNTVKTCFANVLLMPGQQVVFLCRDTPIDTDIPALLVRKNIATQSLAGHFAGDFSDRRINDLNALMDPQVPANRDHNPVLMGFMFAQWFAKFSTSPTLYFFALAGLSGAYLLWLKKEEFVLFSTGWVSMGSEILLIFAFQIFFGYVCIQIGLIITAFLGGLLPGAWFGSRIRRPRRQLLILTDACLIALLILLTAAIRQAGDRLPMVFFLVIGFSISLAGGLQFPIALYLRGDDSLALTRTFSADLVGAACGTLFTSTVLIPYCGILKTAGALIVLKLVSMTILKVRHG